MAQPAALVSEHRADGTRRGPGRPRHTDTEPRAFAAALELLGRRGWAGLTLDGVATQAGIGKSSIYLRWRGKRELLLDAVRDLQARKPPPATEGMDLRDVLVAHAVARAELFAGEHGPALVNLYSAVAGDPAHFAGLREEDLVRGLRSLAPRLRGEPSAAQLPDAAVPHLLDALEGAILVRAVMDRRDGGRPAQADLEPSVAALVDLLLAGARRS